jgi:hypothetical protein
LAGVKASALWAARAARAGRMRRRRSITMVRMLGSVDRLSR